MRRERGEPIHDVAGDGTEQHAERDHAPPDAEHLGGRESVVRRDLRQKHPDEHVEGAVACQGQHAFHVLRAGEYGQEHEEEGHDADGRFVDGARALLGGEQGGAVHDDHGEQPGAGQGPLQKHVDAQVVRREERRPHHAVGHAHQTRAHADAPGEGLQVEIDGQDAGLVLARPGMLLDEQDPAGNGGKKRADEAADN